MKTTMPTVPKTTVPKTTVPKKTVPLAFLLVLTLFATGCGGSASARPAEPDETTEAWTSGDDEALGIGEEESAPVGEAGEGGE